MSYKLVIEEGPGYVHARAEGRRTAENALDFLQKAFGACVKKKRSNLLLEMHWSGPPLDTLEIYRVIAARSDEGSRLRRIAYVEATPSSDPNAPRFAETVANNRGVNVRLFRDVEAA